MHAYGRSKASGYAALTCSTLNEQTFSAAAPNAAGVDFALGASLSTKPYCECTWDMVINSEEIMGLSQVSSYSIHIFFSICILLVTKKGELSCAPILTPICGTTIANTKCILTDIPGLPCRRRKMQRRGCRGQVHRLRSTLRWSCSWS